MSLYFSYEPDGMDEYDMDIYVEDSCWDCDEEDANEYKNFYFTELKSLPKLKRKEVAESYEKTMQGDSLAREDLIKSQLNMIVEVAQRYANRGVDFDDLVQEGNLALINAIGSYYTIFLHNCQ